MSIREDMRALLIILAHQMVGEERLSATRRAQYELVAVGGDAAFHRLVGYIQMDRFPVSLSTIFIPNGEREER